MGLKVTLETTMQSNASTVDAYLKEVPADRLPALQAIRRLCQLHLTGFEEHMAYGGPCYSRDGVIEVGFANQKHNIAVYFMRTNVLDPYRFRFAPSSIGKSCIRYRNPDRIDFDMVEELLIAARDSDGPWC